MNMDFEEKIITWFMCLFTVTVLLGFTLAINDMRLKSKVIDIKSRNAASLEHAVKSGVNITFNGEIFGKKVD